MTKFYITIPLILLFNIIKAQTLIPTNPSVSGGVYFIRPVGDTTFISGYIDSVNGLPRTNFAGFNTITGAVLDWAPKIDGEVDNLKLIGHHLVLAGSFFTADSQPRENICMYDYNTGILENWNDTSIYPSGGKAGLGVDGNYFYFAKYVSSTQHVVIAKADANAGVTTSWQSDYLPNAYDIKAILVQDSFIYVGGDFAYAGADSIFNQLCRFYKSSGKLDTSWHPHAATGIVGNYGIMQIEPYHGNIFIGGSFSTIAGQPRPGIAEIDINGNLTNFNPDNSSDQIFGIKVSGDYLWMAGNSYLMGGLQKWRIAEVNIANQAATCWDVSDTSHTWSIAWDVSVVGDTVYTCAGVPFIFTGSPRPHPGVNGITGPQSVTQGQTAVYHLPYSAGDGYSWVVEGGTGSSHVDSIVVTWGTGPTGLIKGMDDNIGQANCNSDTIYKQISIGVSAILQPESDSNEISAFPNPSKGKVKIVCTEAAINYQLFDITGKILKQMQVGDNIFDIDMTDLAPGMYLVQIQSTTHAARIKLLKN